jgi:glycerol-3-phosphate O-acyltransferase
MHDDISQAVLAREEVLKYPREQVSAYLEELRTTQRHKFYRALQHPLYPILRKIERLHENLHYVTAAVRSHRIVYASNHKSHTDYLVQPLVLDDNGIRPPLIAAGINLFGGPLGLINKHVTGAIPIRRNTKDPAYLITLKAYVAEIVKKHDIFFYPEGGRSYSGELKSAKTGIFNAVLDSDRADLVIVPVAIAYDLVLEDHILAHQRIKKRQRPFRREVAEMVRYAVGYRSRSFTTFGAPITVNDRDVHSRSDVLELARLVRNRIGMLYKVLPSALFAAAMRPNIARRDLESRIDRLIEELAAKHANLGATSGRQVIEEAAEPLATRGIIVAERGRFRVRERTVLRYYGRTIEHLLVTTGRTH